MIHSFAKSMLLHETRALLARLALVKPFALQEPMLPAAALLPAAEVAIDRFLLAGRRELRLRIGHYLTWLKAAGDEVSAVQRKVDELRGEARQARQTDVYKAAELCYAAANSGKSDAKTHWLGVRE